MPPGKQKLHKQSANNKNNGSAPPSAKHPGEIAIPPTTPIKTRQPPPMPMTPGGSTLEYKQIQDDEVEALEAIFMEDYTRVEKAGAWNVRIAVPSAAHYVEHMRIGINSGEPIRPLTMRSNFISKRTRTKNITVISR